MSLHLPVLEGKGMNCAEVRENRSRFDLAKNSQKYKRFLFSATDSSAPSLTSVVGLVFTLKSQNLTITGSQSQHTTPILLHSQD